jgi:hypothetical protein
MVFIYFHIYIYVYMCDFPFQTIHFKIPPLMDPSPPSQVADGRPWRQETTSSPAASTSLNEASRLSKMPRIFRTGWWDQLGRKMAGFYRLCHRKFAENCEKGDLSTKKYWFKCLNISIKNKDVTMNAYTVVGLTMINNMFRWNLIMQRI